MGLGASAYVLANALFEIPSGAMGDRNGRRLELTRIAVWWSGIHRADWLVQDVPADGGRDSCSAWGQRGYPNAAGVISRWFPKQEHARAQGFVGASGRLGGSWH